jgi:hypothetical protein
MKKITENMVAWSVEAMEEDILVRGNAVVSGNDEEDREIEDAIIQDLEDGNEWAWCTVAVRGQYKGLEAVEYLGACSYKDEEDFHKGGYLEGMKKEVVDNLNRQVEAIMQDLK